MFRMFRKIVDIIEEIKAARKYAAENGFNFFAFCDSEELVRNINSTPNVYDESGEIIGRNWLFYTKNLKLHLLLHLLTGGVTGKYVTKGKLAVTYPVTKEDRKKLMK